MSMIAGPYTGTYNAKALGLTREGYRLSHEFFKRMITADEAGDAPVNAVYRGRSQFIDFELLQAGAAAVAELIEPYAASAGVPFTMGVVGSLDVALGECPGAAKQIVLTRINSCMTSPVSATFPLSVIAEGYPINLLYGSDLRQIPIRLRAYPNSSGVFGTVT